MIMLLHFCTQAPEELERQCKIINILDSKSDANVDLSLPVQDFRPKGLETSCQAFLPWHKPQPNEVTCVEQKKKKSHYKNPERILSNSLFFLPSLSPLYATSTPTRGANSSSNLNYTGKERGWVNHTGGSLIHAKDKKAFSSSEY